MQYCDHHGWGWEPERGPTPCVGETLSFWLAAIGLLCSVLAETTLTVQQRAAAAGSFAARVHCAQIVISLAQAIFALAGGVLAARPRGMLCGALVLHSLGWTLAWLVSAVTISRSPATCKRLAWWWLAGAVSNSVVLSSLHRASEVEGHGLPGEIGLLSWCSFLGNALLVLLQLVKPELDATESVYVRVIDRERVVSGGAGSGWQTFWAGSEPLLGSNSAASRRMRTAGRRSGCVSCVLQSLDCCGCFGHSQERGSAALHEGPAGDGGAWPIASVESGALGSLNESLLGVIGLDDSSRHSSGSLAKSKPGGAWTRGATSDGRNDEGCLRRTALRLPCFGMRSRSSASDRVEVGPRTSLRSEDWHCADTARRSARAAEAGVAESLGHARHQSLSVACAPRAPPQASAPVFGVSVTRWRLVDADGIPTAQGSPSDTASTDHSTEASIRGSSARTATVSDAEAIAEAPGFPDTWRDARNELHARHDATVRVELELAVRASGRGEMDWWGRAGAEPSSGSLQGSPLSAHFGAGGSSVATAAGDWRVWRSATDVLALYDALALRFGQDFGGRIARPELKTLDLACAADGPGRDSIGSSPQTRTPHRADILRDARTVGAFLRTLVGLRQFLSTAVMDFLAPPASDFPASLKARTSAREGDHRHSHPDVADGQSWDDSDDASDESGMESTQRGTHGASSTRRHFAGGTAALSSTGEAVAGAALASDYGAWLKRLAVRLRRAAPAGECFVRLRRIRPAVTGEQVVRWLVTSSGESNGDRASAVRLGQDMVSHRLLMPLSAGYDRPPTSSEAPAIEHRDLRRSFDDAVGWLFAYAGDALRDPFSPPPPTEIAVMTGSHLNVNITEWIETSDDQGTHVSFVIHTRVEATQEAWDAPRRYRDFTQLRKRLLRLGIDIPTAAAAAAEGVGGVIRGGSLAPDLPKRTWRLNKFDKDHLDTRRVALEAYLKAAVDAAIGTPHLAGHLVMRFLDPDESNLRLLCELNPFASRFPEARGEGGLTEIARGVAGGSVTRSQYDAGDKHSLEDKEEAEDFNTLTDSLGGFG